MNEFLKKVLPASTFQKLRYAFLFRPEDPNMMMQMMPPKFNPTTVERIQGFRYPSPGSRIGARVPIVNGQDQIYDTNQYVRDPSNIKRQETILINSHKQVDMLLDPPRVHSQNKRKINKLVYDETGLRTTKTANWDDLEEALKKIEPNHLPQAECYGKMEAIWADCEKKDIPYVPGRKFNAAMSANFNKVRW